MHFAAADQVAHGDVHVLVGAQIADGGDASLERPQRAFARQEYFHGGHGIDHLLQQRHARSFVSVKRHVGVDVDQAGQPGVPRKICDLRAGWNSGGTGGHAADFVVVEDHHGIGPQFTLAIP